jgi:hypothetical protein
MWYALARPRILSHFRTNFGEMLRLNPFPSFEQIAYSKPQPEHPSEDEVRAKIAMRRRVGPMPVRTDTFSIESLHQAAEFLIAANVAQISELYRPRTGTGKWIWSGYSVEDLEQNAVAMYQGAATDYADFVRGNRFGRLNSQLISGEKALVLAVESIHLQSADIEPSVKFYWIQNTTRSLPLLTLINVSKERDALIRQGENVTIRGLQYKCTSRGSASMSELFSEFPIRSVLYSWLKSDLEHRFNKYFAI